MEVIDVTALPHPKDNSVSVGGNTYYADHYILMPDGSILMACAKNGTDPLEIVLTKIDPSGRFVITEYASGTTMDEFIELRDSIISSMADRARRMKRDDSLEASLIEDDEQTGDDIVDPDFWTEADPNDAMFV